MRNPINNLGDYNIARNHLKAAGGRWENLYNSIGDTAVAKATPKLLFKGILIGAGVVSIACAGYNGYCFFKDRKKKMENEPALKKEFVEAIEAESLKRNNEEIVGYGEIN